MLSLIYHSGGTNMTKKQEKEGLIRTRIMEGIYGTGKTAYHTGCRAVRASSRGIREQRAKRVKVTQRRCASRD
jgi:hypothetical protein